MTNPRRRISLKIELEETTDEKGHYATWENRVETATVIALPVPNPDALSPMVAALVDHLVAIARDAGLIDPRPGIDESTIADDETLDKAQADDVDPESAPYAGVAPA